MLIRKNKALISSVEFNNINLSCYSNSEILEIIDSWIKNTSRKYICICATHVISLSSFNGQVKKALLESSINITDGRPLFWFVYLCVGSKANHLRGMDFVHNLCAFANKKKLHIGFYGSKQETQKKAIINLKHNYPNVHFFSYIPPFGKQMDDHEQSLYLDLINKDKINILFVVLGCPRQEIWMNRNQDKLNCICVGVGAAIDYIAGNLTVPNKIVYTLGLEWFLRLCMEPKRLFKRYLVFNSIYIYLFFKNLIKKIFDFNK